MTATERRVAVVGGGITGLAAAHALVTADNPAQVVLFEADERIGGKLLTTPFAGLPAIDEGPDAFLARLPWGTELAREVGLGEQLVSPAASKAAVWFERLHDIPEGLLLGMPTDVMKLARSRLLSWPGKLRAALEPLRPRTSLDADSLGGYVRARFGDEVHERLVDPLVGSIYAADTDRFSLAAVPQIADLAARSRSVLLAARRARSSPTVVGPVFYAPRNGMGALAEATARAVGDAGGDIRTSVRVGELAADGGAWRVDGERFDAVILACPAPAASRLLAPLVEAREASDGMAAIEAADVAIVTLDIDRADWPEALRDYSGYLVPKPVQRLVTAASFGSQKWQHWDGRGVVLRVSLGRDGLAVLDRSDEQLLAAAVDEVGHHLGLMLQPRHARVTRWADAFPQYRPHHAERVAAIESALPAGLAVAGAGYHGIGIPACINSGRRAARATSDPARPVAE